MSFDDYISKKKEFQDAFLQFIEDENDYEDDYSNLISIIQEQNLQNNDEELKIFFNFISKILNNHHRYTNFFSKIERIFLAFSQNINKLFSNTEIFSLFKGNNRFLLFLFEQKIITIDKEIVNLIYKHNQGSKYLYFAPELKSFFDEQTKQTIENEIKKHFISDSTQFEEKRKIGENDSYICELIRNDYVIDFITYVNRHSIQLSSQIKTSIFETNSFLNRNEKTTLIEYAAFFGSIQIFQYLRLNNVKLNQSLWLYAIHGKNADLIHLLEENEIKPKDESFNKCLKESIKCHHNDLAKYVYDNLFDEKNAKKNRKNFFNENFFSFCFRYFNYEFFPNEINIGDNNNEHILSYLCKYDYYNLVELYLNMPGFDLKSEIIFKFDVFLIQFFFYK